MPGAIVGIYGVQRSGKTLIAYKLVKGLQQACKQQGIYLPVYTNLYSPRDPDFRFVNSMDELPLDLSPKVVLIDEIYNGCDAQDYRKLKDIHYRFLYLNTGKYTDFVVEKNAALFEGVFYDTNFIPLDFDWEMKSWREKLVAPLVGAWIEILE